mmetsp:Transcript_3598/g.5307  ORF Transcript_3598/g.5307 Transcript_3598/m.5307 type:complete len:99 (+) Transcript_3598:831-1127(+)
MYILWIDDTHHVCVFPLFCKGTNTRVCVYVCVCVLERDNQTNGLPTHEKRQFSMEETQETKTNKQNKQDNMSPNASSPFLVLPLAKCRIILILTRGLC